MEIKLTNLSVDLRIKQTRFNLSLPSSYNEKLRAESKLSGLNVAEIIRRAIDLYLKEIK